MDGGQGHAPGVSKNAVAGVDCAAKAEKRNRCLKMNAGLISGFFITIFTPIQKYLFSEVHMGGRVDNLR